jgi:UDP:flavonoid glycosyltransferase YjiC (YdhE family)
VHYLASAIGSAGDFLPTLAAAAALASRGHRVTFVTSPFHERAVRAANLEYVGVGDDVDLYRRILDDRGVLTSPRALQVLVELAEPHFMATYHATRAMLRAERFDAVVGSNLAFGLHWAAMQRRVPAVMVTATPLFWSTGEAPMQFLDVELPRWLLPLAARGTHALFMGVTDQVLWSIARTVGANAIDPSYSALLSSVALHVGTWHELVRPPAPGDRPNMRTTGFIRAGHFGAGVATLPSELTRFLRAGPPPIVIALGSIFSLDSDALVADLAEASAHLGYRSVIVGPAPRGHALPKDTLVVPYASYHLLFPEAAALVIHGGAGTTGEALRSGRPTVVVPLAFDQFALGWQVERLGTGVNVPKRGRTRARITEALERALESATVARASEVGATLKDAPDGAEVIADLVQTLTPQR